MLCWAADSKVGAVCVIALWLFCHVAVVLGAVHGRFVESLVSAPVLFWVRLTLVGVCLVFVDVYIAVGVVRERRQKEPNPVATAQRPPSGASATPRFRFHV